MMNRNSAYYALIVIAIGIMALSQSIFFVRQGQFAIVLQLGQPVGNVRLPGLNYKIPFIQNIVKLDSRTFTFTIENLAALNSDIKTFELDNYICWRITDPLLFMRTLRTESNGTEKLKAIIVAQIRAAIGGKTLREVVGTSREAILKHVLTEANSRSISYGVEVIDVRIKRTNLPNKPAIFARMNAERKKMANEYRFSGESAAREIRSQAELDRDILLAEAEKQSIIIRGTAEAKAMKIFADAISTSPEIYEFLKSLEVYRNSLQHNTKFILSSEDPILKNFN